MSEVLPFSEAEQLPHYAAGGGAEVPGQISFTCRLQDTSNFYNSAGQGGKRPPKLGQIGRSKREEEDGIDDVMKPLSDKTPPGV
ncbi:calcium/calmodulin-dependent protein kinase II inhibitor 1 isoform X2 [Rhinatrema bivittatum]|uniref:calcium/calmodulin-dependent protein kinase II inhibitor 1 isoform X2 n=1 Tax=Rhinatrema bivittatum TaxID=194408 RepID=UPI00112EE4EA|nr:calcium/calmodulin-dependent protein kinase II inhibitor 1 isoform X2 [Rhinatrema bivittatum]